MKFIRANFRKGFLIIFSTIFLFSCASPSPSSSLQDNQPKSTEDKLEICISQPEFISFDLQAASVMKVLIGDDELVELGEEGAAGLASEMMSLEDGFCGLDSPEKILVALDEIQELIDAGQDDRADDLLDDLLQDIVAGRFSAFSVMKASAPILQTGREEVKKKVQAFLLVAEKADYWGHDDKFQDAMNSASETYQQWASTAIESATIKEALLIAAEAQLLGIEGLDDQALDRARDLAELDLVGELDLFKPCSSTRSELIRLVETAARALLLGVEANTYEIISLAEEWQDIQQRRAKGEDVPECDGWLVNMVLDSVWDAGSHYITWEGRFTESDDGSLQGQGKGTLETHVEIDCVNVMTGDVSISTTDVSGTFVFEIKGRREADAEGDVFKFLFPAELTYSGVDTCNDFEKETYLPAYVIDEINVYGGVENYDPETDLIYLVVPAEDGISVEFETLIGPLVMTLTAPDLE